MRTEEILQHFFEAENSRDWAAYRRFLHPEVLWQLFGGEDKQIKGVEEYVSAIKKAYANTETRFSCQSMQLSKDGSRIAAYLVNDMGQRSLDIFDFKDGLIIREYEFLLDE